MQRGQLDDFNLDDCYFDKFEIYREDTSRDQADVERACFDVLKAMSVEERASALALYEEFWE